MDQGASGAISDQPTHSWFSLVIRCVLVLVCLLGTAPIASAQFMTVKDLDEMLAHAPSGELAATAYVQGVVDGLLAMDSKNQREKGLAPEFCRFFDSQRKAHPELHPAYRTKEILAEWKRAGAPMNTPALNMVQTYLYAQYGCNR